VMDELFRLSQHFLRTYRQDYVRYFLKTTPLKSRFSIIIGQRGIGKTTAMIQHILSHAKNDFFSKQVLYIQADHFLVGRRSLYEIAEQFYNLGGELICFDEIHKYPNWSGELKSIHDTFPNLTITASGSSALEVSRGSHDLSRRAVVYRMFGMSFREFTELSLGISLGPLTLEDIVTSHQQLAERIISLLEGRKKKVLALFSEYLEYGYYPYFRDYKDKTLFALTLEQNIHTTLESDLIAIYPALSGNSVKKLKKLLSIIAASVPFTPDMKKLKTLLDIGDERTLKTYLKYLEDAGIILTVFRAGKAMKGLEKPEKIYLNNTNLIHAIKGHETADTGNQRETFFLNMLHNLNKVSVPTAGDFLINDHYTFEIGGKNKSFTQIKNIKSSFIALDDVETGIGNKIPLWLFGFLY
jgi:predicted AAA+ superfamily ATPase